MEPYRRMKLIANPIGTPIVKPMRPYNEVQMTALMAPELVAKP